MPINKQAANNTADKIRLEENICVHIFTVSAAMIGVCVTTIGIIQIVIKAEKATTFVDDLLAFNAMLFLTSCILSYWAMRKSGTVRMFQIEKVADTIFIIGLVLMVVVSGIIAVEVTWYFPQNHSIGEMLRHPS